MRLNLLNFDKNIIPYSIEFELDVKRIPHIGIELNFAFLLSDPNAKVKIPDIDHSRDLSLSQNWLRKDELWQASCFEIFLQAEGSHGYFEFNFSPAGYWNNYEFQEYRKPQPPQPCHSFQLHKLIWDAKTKELKGNLIGPENLPSVLHIGACAVILETNGSKNYFALNHASNKPDFHLIQSFTIRKEV